MKALEIEGDEEEWRNRLKAAFGDEVTDVAYLTSLNAFEP